MTTLFPDPIVISDSRTVWRIAMSHLFTSRSSVITSSCTGDLDVGLEEKTFAAEPLDGRGERADVILARGRSQDIGRDAILGARGLRLDGHGSPPMGPDRACSRNIMVRPFARYAGQP